MNAGQIGSTLNKEGHIELDAALAISGNLAIVSSLKNV